MTYQTERFHHGAWHLQDGLTFATLAEAEEWNRATCPESLADTRFTEINEASATTSSYGIWAHFALADFKVVAETIAALDDPLTDHAVQRKLIQKAVRNSRSSIRRLMELL